MNLTDKINVMMAKKKDAEIMVRPHNGNEQWTTIENPDFNWGVADYKVKPDYKLLFDKFQAAFVYDELYAAVHAQERGQNLPNIVDELSNQLATYKTSVLNKVENELLVCTSPLLSLTEFKKSIPGKTLAGILQKKLELEGKSKEEIETELEKGLIAYLAELNSVIKTNLSTIRSSIKDQLALTLDKQILDIKALEENDLIKKEYTTKNKLKSTIINLFLEAVEKFFKDETEKYIFCKNGNFGITITRNTDKNNPTIQFFYLAYNKIDGFNDVPAIDWTLNADKVVTVSNITVQQLKDLQNSVDESKHICKTNYNNLKARVDLEIQNSTIKSEKIKELEQEITKLKEDNNDLLEKIYQKMPLNPVAYYNMGEVQYKTILDHGCIKSTGKYEMKILGDLTQYCGRTIRITVSGYREGEGGFPNFYIFEPNWKWNWNSYTYFDSLSERTLQYTIEIPQEYSKIICAVYHWPDEKKNNTAVMTRCIIELVDNDKLLVDSSGNGNHISMSGDTYKINDDYVGVALKFRNGNLFHGRDLTSLLKYDKLSLAAEASDNWCYKNTSINNICRKGYTYTFKAYFRVISGSPNKVTLLYYDSVSNKEIVKADTDVVNGKCMASITFRYNPTSDQTVYLIAYSGLAGHTANISSEYSNFSLIEHPELSCIGVNKTWCHSRWLKIDSYKPNTYAYPYSYGRLDWFSLRDGKIITNSSAGDECAISVDVSQLIGKWTHVVVQTECSLTYCVKEVYINGKLIDRKRVDGDFSNIQYQIPTDMTFEIGYVDGSLANLLFFNRFLTRQEIAWLYNNPQYPVKYTFSDYKSNKQFIGLLKNGYIQWPGMPSPLEDANLQFEGYSWYKVNYGGNFFRAERRNAGVFSTKKLAKEQIKNGDYIFKDDEQEDAIRNIKGRLGVKGGKNSSGPFYNELNFPVEVESWNTANYSYRENAINFDLTKADGVNIAEENRPRNLTFIIWALVKD